MTKTLTEQWREGTLPRGGYYIKRLDGSVKQTDYDNISKSFDTEFFRYNVSVEEVLAPVPSYDKVKEMSQKIERLELDNEALEMAHNEEKEKNAELVSKTDELVQKVHILNEQNTKQYNELCEEIKERKQLEKKLEIATEALKLYADDGNWCNCLSWNGFMEDNEVVEDGQFGENGYEPAQKALKEMEGVK